MSIIALGIASKLSLLLHVLTILICYLKYFDWKKHKLRLFFFALLGVVIMFLSFSAINIKGRGTSTKQDQTDMVDAYQQYGRFDWNYSSSLFLPFMYLESPWGNVEYVVETQDERTYGLWTLKPLLGYVGADVFFKEKYELVPNSSFNTFTFVSVAFKDFGIWLSVISTLLLGFFVKKVYTRYLISRSPYDVACWCTVALATVEMFFSNHFYMQSYPFTCVILMEIYKRISFAMGEKKVELDF
jgi:oligosaccharide repeat unit polymerase